MSQVELVFQTWADLPDLLVVAVRVLDLEPLVGPVPLRRKSSWKEKVQRTVELDRLPAHRRSAQSELPASRNLYSRLGEDVALLGQSRLVVLVYRERVPLDEIREVAAT